MSLYNAGRKPFDLLSELAKFGREHKISMNDSHIVSKFTTFVSDELSTALSDPALLHGQRTESMFEALLISLGGYSLLNKEDSGRAYPEEGLQPPDFRVVLPDGTQWLIEVKNVYIEDPSRQERHLMSRAYLEKLERYASLTGGHLKLAVYWARWRIWTLVSPERLVDEKGNLTLDMQTGIAENELGRLGDRTIGTRPPLRLRLETDPAKPRTVDADGTVNFTVSNVRVYSDQDEILDPVEREIAWIFMLYGDWQESEEPLALLEGDILTGIEFQWEPELRQNKGFEIIGTLSRMFCRYYAERTLENQEIAQLQAPLRPGWFAPLTASDYQKKALPLWLFTMKPRGGSTIETN